MPWTGFACNFLQLWDQFSGYERHQLYKAFLHMTSPEHFGAGNIFCDGILLVGVPMSSSNPITAFIVTKLSVTEVIARLILGGVIP